ncbi:putative fungal specific transcription factor protein [Daldinia childiae]|uniref:putative fungal specific transcription factor protein n=1 Tax=Daldinia childiae TaxID=326645 RepID=UPI0014476F38|nr:putative fungal specific transcription factor protein [Daldinia childiae]KAF3059630.1 putative fungal specific transcription factor protein [Daldinia childiae]
MNDRTDPPLLLRRNGRPQACDPCRKRKLACDHTQPVCSRCKKRKQDGECVYLASGSRISASKSPLPSPAPSTPLPSPRRGSLQHSQNSSALTPDAQVSGLTRPGYLGPTSYCNIYEDTENSLSLLQGSDRVTTQSESVAHHTPIEGSQTNISARVRDMALAVLRNIPDPIQGSTLRFKPGSDGWIRNIAEPVVKSLYETFGDYFSPGNRPTAKLEELAQIICANTLRPFSDDESDPDKWFGQFLGKNIRWELIGILSIFWEFVPGSTTEFWNGKRSAEFDRGFRIARENMHLSLDLCKELSAGNSMMLCLSQRCTVMDSMSVGDADDQGWNTDGEIYPSTNIRARAIIAIIREEIFKIALNHRQNVLPNALSIETLLQLRSRELSTVSAFPSCLRFDPFDIDDPDVPINHLSARLFIQQEHLQNMFFIERLLLRFGHQDKGDLLKVSYDLVTQTLPWNDCEWLVMAYAVPAGGILCLELLKPTLHLRPHNDSRITRSNIIQKLSLLVAFLDWVSPSAPNGDLCNDAKSVIQRVLDQTLNAASSIYEPPAVFQWDSSTQLDFNFDLLDTFDWIRPDFPSSQQSNQ